MRSPHLWEEGSIRSSRSAAQASIMLMNAKLWGLRCIFVCVGWECVRGAMRVHFLQLGSRYRRCGRAHRRRRSREGRVSYTQPLEKLEASQPLAQTFFQLGHCVPKLWRTHITSLSQVWVWYCRATYVIWSTGQGPYHWSQSRSAGSRIRSPAVHVIFIHCGLKKAKLILKLGLGHT